jgi:hypothetical protein
LSSGGLLLSINREYNCFVNSIDVVGGSIGPGGCRQSGRRLGGGTSGGRIRVGSSGRAGSS